MTFALVFRVACTFTMFVLLARFLSLSALTFKETLLANVFCLVFMLKVYLNVPRGPWLSNDLFEVNWTFSRDALTYVRRVLLLLSLALLYFNPVDKKKLRLYPYIFEHRVRLLLFRFRVRLTCFYLSTIRHTFWCAFVKVNLFVSAFTKWSHLNLPDGFDIASHKKLVDLLIASGKIDGTRTYENLRYHLTAAGGSSVFTAVLAALRLCVEIPTSLGCESDAFYKELVAFAKEYLQSLSWNRTILWGGLATLCFVGCLLLKINAPEVPRPTPRFRAYSDR